MDETLVIILATVSVVVGVAALAALALMLSRSRQNEAAADATMAEVIRLQADAAARLQAMGEMLTGRQSALERALHERLDSATHRLGQSMQSTTLHTVENLQKLNERLAVIDNAQKHLSGLASQVTSLSAVLSNKQTRGAFGQGRMETIIQDGLPKGFFEFQYTLSNRTRPDCAVFLPDQRPLVIDAKFPLEAVTAWRDARSEDERRQAAQRLRQDVGRHVSDIAAKYLIPGETHELALMFVPSESVYADLHDGFDDLLQKAYRARVVLVSPSLLMLAIQVVQQIQRDARMRAAADQIRTEVELMLDDLGRLRERVVKLERHFGQANEDIRQILVSAEKVDRRAVSIRELEFEGEAPASATVIPAPIRKLQVGP